MFSFPQIRSMISAAGSQRYARATVIVALCALLPCPVEAVCPHWDVSGKWNIEQENPTALLEMDLSQSGTEVIGTAKYNGAQGKVKGTVVGDDFNVEISDPAGKRVLRGTIGPARIAGMVSLPGASEPTIWYSTTAMKCAEAPRATTVVPKSAGSESVAPEIPPPTTSAAAGKIFANPSYPTVPSGQTEGITTLTWDGGGDHSNAEVWVKIDDEDEKLLVKEGKGSRQVQVKPNKVYLYLLKASGRQIDSVTVIAVK